MKTCKLQDQLQNSQSSVARLKEEMKQAREGIEDAVEMLQNFQSLATTVPRQESK